MVEGNIEICYSQMTKPPWPEKSFEFSFAQSGATGKKQNFRNLCELRKIRKYSLRPTFTNPNFEPMDEFLKSFVLIQVSLSKVKGVIYIKLSTF